LRSQPLQPGSHSLLAPVRLPEQGLEQRLTLRRRLGRGLLGERRDLTGELEQGVVADLRQGSVARAAFHPQFHPEDPLLTDAQRVEAAVVDLDRNPAALIDDEVAVDLLRMLLANPLGAESASG